MKLQHVLLIEDNERVRQDVINEFDTHGVQVVQVNDYEDLELKLPSLPPIQMVILDWLLDGETENDALLCLAKLRETRFVPVIIWTEELGKFEEAESEVKTRFPETYFRGLSKSQVNYQTLLQELSRWHEQAPVRLAEQFRQSVATAVEQTLYTLAEQSADDLTKGLKTLISLGEANSEVDLEHATDVMLRILGRQLYNQKAFTNELKRIVADLATNYTQPTKKERAQASKRRSQMEELYMYYRPSDDIVRNGDIVQISWETGENLAIVLTPACDLANPGKTAYLRLGLLNPQPDRGNGTAPDDRWPLLYSKRAYEVCFHETLALQNISSGNDKSGSVMRYAHTYQALIGTAISLRRECRLDDPYRSDLLHQFVSHAGRVGRPDFTG